MADRLDPPELLGVDVDQLARPLALIAHDRRPRLERRQLAEPETAQDAADRRDRHGQLARDRRAAQALPPPALDLGHARGRHLVATVLAAPSCGRSAPPSRRRDSARASGKPAVPTVPQRRRPTPPSSPGLDHPLHQQESTLRRQTRILVHVHPGDLPISAATVASRSLTGPARMNNLHSNHS